MLASEILVKFIAMKPKYVLNLGDKNNSKHTKAMKKAGIEVETLGLHDPTDIKIDYRNAYVSNQEAIWCSHVLEHQINPGDFLFKIFSDLQEGGILAITVPPPKAVLTGGHVTIWTEATLIYQLVMVGFDCSKAKIWRYGYNISCLMKKVSRDSTIEWTRDKFDLDILQRYIPESLRYAKNNL